MLHPIDWKDFVRRLHALGFDGPLTGGKHPKMRKGDQGCIIPNEHVGTLGVGFLKRLLRQLKISTTDWESTE
jgi:predicted RNA binding protein YcfA (HicA-like mRNA interferase family)